MTPQQILDLKQKIRELDAAATKGEWQHDLNGFIAIADSDGEWGPTILMSTRQPSKQQLKDCDFAAFAREALPTLLAYCEELEGKLRKANQAIDELNQAFIDENI